MKNPSKTKFLGFPLLNGDRAGILMYLCEKIEKKECIHIVTLNALMCEFAMRDSIFRRILEKAECVNDSFGISLVNFIKTGKWLPRFQGIELFENLLKFCGFRKKKVFFFGAGSQSNRLACEVARKKFPGIRVSGFDGYSGSPLPWILEEEPDVVFVALSLPEQERWIAPNAEVVGCPLMGIGGSLDVFSGKIPRANIVLRNLGIEWLWRLIKEPWRIKRILRLPIFFVRSLLSSRRL